MFITITEHAYEPLPCIDLLFLLAEKKEKKELTLIPPAQPFFSPLKKRKKIFLIDDLHIFSLLK